MPDRRSILIGTTPTPGLTTPHTARNLHALDSTLPRNPPVRTFVNPPPTTSKVQLTTTTTKKRRITQDNEISDSQETIDKTTTPAPVLAPASKFKKLAQPQRRLLAGKETQEGWKEEEEED